MQSIQAEAVPRDIIPSTSPSPSLSPRPGPATFQAGVPDVEDGEFQSVFEFEVAVDNENEIVQDEFEYDDSEMGMESEFKSPTQSEVNLADIYGSEESSE